MFFRGFHVFLVPVLIGVPQKHLAFSLIDPKMWKFSYYGGKKHVDQPQARQSDRDPSALTPFQDAQGEGGIVSSGQPVG